MKRLISLALVLVMVLALSTAAFADDPVGPSVKPTDLTFLKTYKTTAGGTPTTFPKETLTFGVEASTSNRSDGASGPITIADVKTTGEAATENVVIVFPTYTKVGVYDYTIWEKAGSTTGVTYDTTKYRVRVTITNAAPGVGEADTLAAAITVRKITNEADGTVADTKLTPDTDSIFTNIYDLGSLTVTKTVSGNMASNEEAFDIDVTFKAETPGSVITLTKPDGTTQDIEITGTATTISLSNGKSATFTNIPVGVTYTVAEQTKYTGAKQGGGTTKETNDWFYDAAEYKLNNNAVTSVTDQAITVEGATVSINNNKSVNADTGITLDSLPYILIALVAVIAIAVVVIRKRHVEE